MSDKNLKFRVIDFSQVPKDADVDYEAVHMCIEIDLPFVPAAGSFLKVTPKGDYLEVGVVYFDTAEPGVVDIWIKEDSKDKRIPPFEELIEQGWTELNESIF